jgi:hypothetical protein
MTLYSTFTKCAKKTESAMKTRLCICYLKVQTIVSSLSVYCNTL